MRVRLTKIFREANLDGGLRTESVEGELIHPYKVGTYFEMMGESLTGFGDARYVSTSAITEIEEDKEGELIHTKSGSIYRVEEV